MDLSNETDLDNKNSLEVQNIWKFNASMIKKSHTRLKKNDLQALPDSTSLYYLLSPYKRASSFMIVLKVNDESKK